MEILKYSLTLLLVLSSLKLSAVTSPSVVRSTHSPSKVFEAAQYYYKQQDWSRSLSLALLAQNKGYQSTTLYTLLARSYNKLGRPDLALGIILIGMKKYPRDTFILTTLAYTRYLNGHYRESIDAWREAWKQAPAWQKDYIITGLAKAYRESGDWERSEKWFKKGLKRPDFWLLFEYAALLEKRGDHRQAALTYARARQYEKKQAPHFQQLIRNKEAALWYRLALDAKKQKEYALSRDCFKKIMDDPELHDTPSYEKAEYWNSRLP